jgi:hypothetical protein
MYRPMRNLGIALLLLMAGVVHQGLAQTVCRLAGLGWTSTAKNSENIGVYGTSACQYFGVGVEGAVTGRGVAVLGEATRANSMGGTFYAGPSGNGGTGVQGVGGTDASNIGGGVGGFFEGGDPKSGLAGDGAEFSGGSAAALVGPQPLRLLLEMGR